MIRNAVIIPALDPDEKFPDFVSSLCPDTEHPVIIVNDGTKGDRLSVFDRLSKIPHCHVLHHEVNFGKGRALKTAFSYYMEHFSHLDGVVTADCDGQHSLHDITRTGQAICENPDAIILGSRDFSNKGIPYRSVIGNRFNALVFGWLYGTMLPDTQTGLRGFPTSLIPWLLSIPGDRFEYEMTMLILACRKDIKLVAIPIETIYINQNVSSHYNIWRDSRAVGKSLFSGLFIYSFSSIISAVLDVAIFISLNAWVLSMLPNARRLLIATVAARIVSSIVNYYVNHRIVFKSSEFLKKSFVRYYFLWLAQLAASYAMTLFTASVLKMNANFTKLFIDLLLSIMSYQVQMRWVFKNRPLSCGAEED